jgi:hypothetical protein
MFAFQPNHTIAATAATISAPGIIIASPNSDQRAEPCSDQRQ